MLLNAWIYWRQQPLRELARSSSTSIYVYTQNVLTGDQLDMVAFSVIHVL